VSAQAPPTADGEYLVVFRRRWAILEYTAMPGWLWGDGTPMSLDVAADVTHWRALPELPRAAPTSCRAQARGGSMYCPCGMTWDINDPEPPVCPAEASR